MAKNRTPDFFTTTQPVNNEDVQQAKERVRFILGGTILCFSVLCIYPSIALERMEIVYQFEI